MNGGTVKRGTTETRGSMLVEWDVAIPLRDGHVLRADVFRPKAPGSYPVLMTHGPYSKWLSFQQGFPFMWRTLEEAYPDIVAATSNELQVWETPDPERWVPEEYVCIRVDSRGAGRSEGFIEVMSEQEAIDFYDCIEWAGVQPWSNGKVGLLGVSYYATNQWHVAALQPPHLAAICPWEGSADYYREFLRNGGILSEFYMSWYPATIDRIQHGLGERGEVSTITGEPVAGPETLTPEELAANRPDWLSDLRKHTLLDEYHMSRMADLSRITVPTLSAGNWAHHIHTRGNLEAFNAISSEQKWLEVHGLEHWVLFYSDYGVNLQRQFFDYFLKGVDNGWNDRPAVVVNVREVDGTFSPRGEDAWPLPRTEWTTSNLDAATRSLRPTGVDAPAEIEVPYTQTGVTFLADPVTETTEVTGPLAAVLYVSTDQADVDVFVTLRVLDPNGEDVRLRSALDPAGVTTVGWLRASQRALDTASSTPYRPIHPHDREEPLVRGEVYRLDIEIIPTSIVLPPGYRLGLSITGQDFQFDGPGPWPELYGIEMRGQGTFLHNDEVDRPAEIYAQPFRVHTGPDHPSTLLIPVIPRAI